MLRLPREVAPIFREWLEANFPDRASRVMGRIRDTQGGRDYDPEWGKRMTGQGEFSRLMAHRFGIQIRRLGLAKHLLLLRTDLFQPPIQKGDQLLLF